MAIDVGRVALTTIQLRATEIDLYRMADAINRLKKDGVQYTKVVAPAGEGAADAPRL